MKKGATATPGRDRLLRWRVKDGKGDKTQAWTTMGRRKNVDWQGRSLSLNVSQWCLVQIEGEEPRYAFIAAIRWERKGINAPFAVLLCVSWGYRVSPVIHHGIALDRHGLAQPEDYVCSDHMQIIHIKDVLQAVGGIVPGDAVGSVVFTKTGADPEREVRLCSSIWATVENGNITGLTEGEVYTDDENIKDVYDGKGRRTMLPLDEIHGYHSAAQIRSNNSQQTGAGSRSVTEGERYEDPSTFVTGPASASNVNVRRQDVVPMAEHLDISEDDGVPPVSETDAGTPQPAQLPTITGQTSMIDDGFKDIEDLSILLKIRDADPTRHTVTRHTLKFRGAVHLPSHLEMPTGKSLKAAQSTFRMALKGSEGSVFDVSYTARIKKVQ